MSIKPETLKNLVGKWLILENDVILAYDNDLEIALATARQKGVVHPFVYKVPPEIENPIA